MFISKNYSCYLILFTFLVSNDLCFCMLSEFGNATLARNGFSSAVATWYGEPTGAGSGGACGFENDVINAPYYGMISAGNKNLFRSGAGCGTCYTIYCTENPACSGRPISVTITDECPGACNNEPFHFDLSGKAFGYLAKPGQADLLRKAGRINVEYTRVNCYYKSKIAFKIDAGSNRYYLSFAVENASGDGEITQVEILPRGWKSWAPMQRVFGETWKFNIPSGAAGPYSVKLTDHSGKFVVALTVIPANWAPRKTYYSTVNFA